MALLARAPLLCATFFAIATLLCPLAEADKINITMYIQQVWSGTGTNQVGVIGGSNGFGSTIVTDWPIHNKPPADPSAKVIGFARGLHTQANVPEHSWFMATDFLFRDEGTRYNGSTLAVIGMIPFATEWSIVGGTGLFRMARGYAQYTVDPPSGSINGKRLYKIDAHVVYGESDCTCNTIRSEAVADN